jgi:hypothetical protein
MVGESLKNEIKDSLTHELSKESGFDALILEEKINNVIRDVVRVRKYPSSYSEKQIEEDLSNYYSNVRNLALYDYNMVGAEFQQSHSENGINRSYTKRQELFSGIIPIARF